MKNIMILMSHLYHDNDNDDSEEDDQGEDNSDSGSREDLDSEYYDHYSRPVLS
jgi:hypothetical protein